MKLAAFLVTLTGLSCVASSAAEEARPGPATVLRVEDHRERAASVRAWDPRSPQKLVRIDGKLHQEYADKYFPAVATQITVRLAEGVADWDDLVSRALAKAPETYGVLSRLEPVRSNRLGIVDLAVPAGTNLVDWCELAHRTGLVRYAEVATHGVYLATQTDPRYPEQWALHNTGQTGGTPGADIDAERAWDLTAGDPAIVVAIIDSGTDVDHEDLAANVWHNEGETPGNMVDDDGNGYVDDWEGWDFDNGDNDPRSSNPHGTHVAGIVNASGSNGVGVAGLAGGLGGPGVRGMMLGVGSAGPNTGVIDDAILYAADNGAHVITLSLSVGQSQAIDDALAYAYGTRDVFIDCASGNSGSSVGYPAVRVEVMAVGATTDDDLASGFSNPGPEVEVAAPGSSVLSTRPSNSYGTDSGTSFAAPYVAGLAGLIRSRNPGLPAAEVRQLIIDSADDVHDPGFDEKTGYGRINAFSAVALAANSDGAITLDSAGYPCGATADVTVSDIDLAGAGSISVVATSDSEPGGESIILTEAGAASGVFRGSVVIEDTAAITDGLLQVSHGDTIVVTYVDADDGQGGTDVDNTDTADVDCLPPIIASVGTEGISDTAATVTWSTDEPSTSAVRAGEAIPPGSGGSAPELVVEHAVTLSGLQSCTTYYFEVESVDAQGNLSVDDNAGGYHSFETWGDFAGAGIMPCRRGQVFLDRDTTYGCEETVAIAVVDTDLDADPQVAETVGVLVTSSTEPAGEWVTLTEIATQNSRFEGEVALSAAAPSAGDGLVAVSSGDLISATYFDADDGVTGAYTAVDTAIVDCASPFISDVRISGIAATRAVVEWNTAEPASSVVEFGATSSLGLVAEQTALVTVHRVSISPFDACDRVHYRVSSADVHGNTRVADVDGQPFEFNVNEIGGLVFHETFETDTGWTLPGDWERGSPQGLGTLGGDPSAAWSGSAVIGNDLSGQGAYPGDYEPSTSASAISPSFSTRQERDLELIVQRKLGVTSADEAGIYVITNGTDQVWTSNYQINDDDWWEQRKDISAWADNDSSVQLEFRIESTNPDHSYGWNIDEVIVKDSTLPDYLVCGGCAGAPSFAGVGAVYDPDPCGSGGLVIAWESAAAWGTGSSGSYEVHRGDTPDFVPAPANRVASGLTQTTWTDVSAPPGATVWYVVRARNDESCTGGEGLDDGNLVRLPAAETVSVPPISAVGSTLQVSTVGGAHVRLEWDPVSGADHYVVQRGQAADFSDAVEIDSTGAAFYEDPGAAIPDGLRTYRVLAVDVCGRPE